MTEFRKNRQLPIPRNRKGIYLTWIICIKMVPIRLSAAPELRWGLTNLPEYYRPIIH